MLSRSKMTAIGTFTVATILLAGCGGGATGAAAWTTPKDAIDGLAAAGFTCLADPAATPEVVSSVDHDGNPNDSAQIVTCDDYLVWLVSDQEELKAQDRLRCASPDVTAETWATWETWKSVDGSNFFVSSYEWPATAQPEDFVKAFGGIIQTDAQYFEGIGCKRPAK